MAGARRRRDKGTHEHVPACRPGVGTDFGHCRRSVICHREAAASCIPDVRLPSLANDTSSRDRTSMRPRSALSNFAASRGRFCYVNGSSCFRPCIRVARKDAGSSRLLTSLCGRRFPARYELDPLAWLRSKARHPVGHSRDPRSTRSAARQRCSVHIAEYSASVASGKILENAVAGSTLLTHQRVYLTVLSLAYLRKCHNVAGSR
jgi:hypothetical protein